MKYSVMGYFLVRNAASVFLLACLALTPYQLAMAKPELTDLSFEQLMSVEVTSASNKSQTLGEIAGAVFVISAEDIRRSGVTSVAEALRMVPGMHVARIDDTRWAVSARGFNDQFSNKLSVMIDGRHIYTPNFAGVFWDDHMPLIDNVERIEVIRGPGAAIEGLNAVNGVISIISRSVRDTQGLLLQGRIGNRDLNGITARYGSVTESGWYHRFSYHSVDENITDSPLDAGNFDNLSHQRGSFRVDGPEVDGQSVRLAGSIYRGDSRQVTRVLTLENNQPRVDTNSNQINSRGFWLQGHWDFEKESGESLRAQAYIQSTERDYNFGELKQETISVNIRGRNLLGDKNDINWGAEAYFAKLPFNQRSELVAREGVNDDYHIYRFHVQDEIAFQENLSVSLGARFEKSQYLDWRAQPNVRLAWKQSPSRTLWASAASTYRNPSFGESEYTISPSVVLAPLTEKNPTPLPISASWKASQNNFGAEKLVAFEAGIKGRLTQKLTYDLSFFNFHYDDLLSGEFGSIRCQPDKTDLLSNPGCLANNDFISLTTGITTDLPAETTGIELAMDLHLSNEWRIQASFSKFDFDFTPLNVGDTLIDFSDVFLGIGSKSEPEWAAYIRSEWDVSSNLELDFTLRAVDESEVFDIDSYITADIRLEWKPNSDVRVEFIGQNIFDSGHTEFGSRILEAVPSGIQHSLFARITWAP